MFRIVPLIAMVMVTSLAPAAFGQVSSDQAAEKLRQRTAAREAAATRPATITQGELDKLRADLQRLTAENARLGAENAALKAKLAPPTARPAKAHAPDAENYRKFQENLVGMTMPEAMDALAAYGATGNPPVLDAATETAKDYHFDTNSTWNMCIFHVLVGADGKITSFIVEPQPVRLPPAIRSVPR